MFFGKGSGNPHHGCIPSPQRHSFPWIAKSGSAPEEMAIQ
jgi:hypothetical protein